MKPIPKPIEQKILELKSIEIKLGNLPSEIWTVGDLQKRAFDDASHQNMSQLNNRSESLFVEICEALDEIHFTHAEIAAAVNASLKFDGGPKYCSETEVNEALS